MRIGIVGGTGKQGSGLAVRWARAGHAIVLGSRDVDKAVARAAELKGSEGWSIEGGDNPRAARDVDVVLLSVPYAAHAETLLSIKDALAGKPIIDMTVPLKPPKVNRVQLPAGGAAALETATLLGPGARVAAALHHVSSTHLADPDHTLACDVLVVSDDAGAKAVALELVRDLGLRGLDAGPLANAIALESLTPVLIHLNRTYKSSGAGVVFTNLPPHKA